MAIKGFVYVMSNKSMPGIIKIGMSTKMPEERAKELSSDTSTPTPFIVEYYAIFDDMIKAERMAHQRLKPHHHGKEFFSTSVENAIYSIEELGLSFLKLYSRIDYENEIRERRIKEQAAIEKKAIEKAQAEREAAKKEKLFRFTKAATLQRIAEREEWVTEREIRKGWEEKKKDGAISPPKEEKGFSDLVSRIGKKLFK